MVENNTKTERSLDIPNEFGARFKIGEEISKGTSCYVYAATDSQLGDREVVVKVFIDRPLGDQDRVAEFEEEMKALRDASHSSLVPIIACGCEEDWFYLAMESLSGPRLRDVLKDQAGPLEVDRVLYIAKDIGDGLKEIHEQGIYHGHLDSRAIMFKSDHVRVGGYYPPVLERILRSTTSGSRLTVDAAYIAPEQVSEPDAVNFRADIYSLSVLIFEMLTGERPFKASNPLQLAMMRTTQSPPSAKKINSSISPVLDAAISKGMAKDPKERFQSVDELLDAITGGKGFTKNPLEGAGFADEEDGPERMSTETIPVSMSTDKLKEMLASHQLEDSKKSEAPAGDGSVTAQHSSSSATEGEQMDVAATMMGAPSVGALRGSFIMLNGPSRGKKYLMEKNQTIIGSDTASDICVKEKNVPKRYAIVTQAGDEFSVGALSGEGLTINENEFEGKDDVPLKRGDVLMVGGTRVRFVAPGEVFTLQDEIADRVVDRAESKFTKFAPYVAAVFVVFCAVGVFMWTEARDDEKAKLIAKTKSQAKERSELVASLVKAGDDYYKAGQFIEPIGANAKEKYKAVLEYNPDNLHAKQRLIAIEERLGDLAKYKQLHQQQENRIKQLLEDGERYFDEGKLISPPGSNARGAYKEVLRVKPDHEIALKKIAEIEQMLGDLVGRVQVKLARAQVYIDLGQYVEPPRENAYALLKDVLKIDTANEKAQNALLDMAAYSVFEGDRAKKSAKVRNMKRSYLVAQTLGVNPAYLKPRIDGAKLIEQSSSRVVIYDRKEGTANLDDMNDDAGGYLSSKEIDQRVASLSLKTGAGTGTGRVFIDLSR